MGYQVYQVGPRWGGYGVPAYCEHPRCKEEIDRGISYACGGEPFSEVGCDRYFCGKHRVMVEFTGDNEVCEHEQDIDGTCDCAWKEVCQRCSKGKPPFPYKPEHPTWVKHLLKDPSWATWRKNNPDDVRELRSIKR